MAEPAADVQVFAEFVTSAADSSDFPRDRLPEVALVGRSNVGKSSLINALARRQIARTSSAPGKTRLANFYRVKRGPATPMYLVDLPGYGYARGRREDQPGPFAGLTDAYFARALGTEESGSGTRDSRLGIRGSGAGARDSGAGTEERAAAAESRLPIGVLLLVDARHPGLESDLEAWQWVGALPCPRSVIGTKVDKLTRAERARHQRVLQTVFERPVPLVSAHTGEGLEELWKLIVRLPSQTAA